MNTQKRTLRFDENGRFRILMVSDIQETLNYDKRALKGLFAMLEAVKPDLMILGGDNVDGRKVKTYEELKEYLDIFTQPMETTKTPWMHVYGNHDYDVNVSGMDQSKLYESYESCISGHSPEGVPGASNYMIPILSKDSDKVAFCVYAFDTHYKNPVYGKGVTTESLLLPNKYKWMRKWDVIRFEQQMWYWNTSKALEEKQGGTVRAMAVMHVIPPEVQFAVKNPEETGMKGEYAELTQCGAVNSGFFATALQRGDVEIIAAGHSHEDTIDAVYGGIRFCLDGCAGFTPYGLDECRGGRVFDIFEDGSHETHMVAVKDLMDIYDINDLR